MHDSTTFSEGNITFTVVTSNWTTVGDGDCIQVPPSLRIPCNNAENLISKEGREWAEEVAYVWILPLMSVVGFVTNIINCAVFLAQGLTDRINMCLFCLSIADGLYLLMLYVRYFKHTGAHLLTMTWANNVWLASLIRYRLVSMHAGFALVSNFISIVIAVERCLCVTWPLRAARVLKTSILAAVIAVSSVLIFAGMQFVALKYDITCAVVKGHTSAPFMLVSPSQLYKDYPFLMDALDTFIFSSLVPTFSLFVTAVATTITALKLRQAAAWRDSASGGSGNCGVINQKEKAMTRLLIVISCVYMACVSPRVLRSLSRFLVPEFRAWGKLCNLVHVSEIVMNAMMALNSSINFFVYLSMASRFRATLLVCSRTKRGSVISRQATTGQ